MWLLCHTPTLQVMQGRPTGVVAASRDAELAREVQELFASPVMRVNTSTDVIGARQGPTQTARIAVSLASAWATGGGCWAACTR